MVNLGTGCTRPLLGSGRGEGLTIRTPDNSFVYNDQITELGNVTVDYTHTQLGGSRTFAIGDFDNGGGIGNLRGSANLATGELRIYADALAGLPNSPFGGAGADIIGVVGFADRVFINGSWTGLLPVEISLGLSGSYTPIEGTGFQLILNTASSSGPTSLLVDTFGGTPIPPSLTTTVMVSEFQPFVDFSALRSARAQDSTPLSAGELSGIPQFSIANFENTGILGISLPSSAFSFTSESTVLLTQSFPSVPEPSSLLLLGAGLVGLAAWRWKRAA